jgi:hypothetical protein
MAVAGLARIGWAGASATYTWNTGNGTYSDTGNWTPTAPVGGPTSADTAQFNQATSPTVTFTSSPTNTVLSVTAGNVTFTASGAARTYTLLGSPTVQNASLSLAPGSNTFTLSAGNTFVNVGGSLSVPAGTSFSCTGLGLAGSGGGTAQITVDGGSFAVSGGTSVGVNGGVGTLTFQNNATGSFGVFNLTLAVAPNAGANLTVDTGSDVTVSGNIGFGPQSQTGQVTNVMVTGVGSTFSQTGNTTTTLGGSANSVATLTVTDGGAYSTGTGTFTINPTGELKIQQVLNHGTFDANGNMQILAGGALTIDGGTDNWLGTFDLHGHKLVYHATAGTKATILSRLQNQALYGSTHSTGIVSSGLGAGLAVAVIDNGALATPFGTFGGLSADGNSILVSPELLGDANVDGVVNFADFVLLSNHYGQANQGWVGADFNGDGVVNFADFVQLSNHYGQTYGSPSFVVGPDEFAAFASASAAFFAGAAPEPGTVLLLGVGLAALGGTRRRRGGGGGCSWWKPA